MTVRPAPSTIRSASLLAGALLVASAPTGDLRGQDLQPFSTELALDVATPQVAAATDDVGLVAVTRALALPTGTATALFAVGRSVGWVAHAIEQHEAGYLVRPRARYREA